VRRILLGLCSITVAFLALDFLFLAAGRPARAQDGRNSTKEQSVRKFLQDYVGMPASAETRTTKYFCTFVDLKDDGAQEAIVYLTDDGWCGSGGCTTLVLAPKGSSYELVTKITVTRLPIRVLATKSHGWHDIAVQVQGGGILHAYEAKLSFDGKTYPSNPSIPPAQRLGGRVAGEIAVPLTATGAPLY